MDGRISLGKDICKCRRWILSWWSYTSSTAGTKIVEEELQRSPMDSTCCVTLGKALGETSALAGRRTGAASVETFFWCIMGTVYDFYERYSHNKEMPRSTVSFS